MAVTQPPDNSTQSNYFKIATEHVVFVWTIDWKEKKIVGSTTHTLRVREDSVKEVVFDTFALDVKGAQVEGKAVPYDLGKHHDVMGSALSLPLPSGLKRGATVTAKVEYETTSGGQALQWLEPEQTQGKQHPYLFSQCQAILARALAPLQDTPSLKITYDAQVSSILPALMSAIRVSPPSAGPPHGGKVIGKDVVTYVYKQPISIPSYLLAIASGNLHYRAFDVPQGKDWTSGVWTEPEMLDQAHWEFKEDTTRNLALEESVIMPYKFGVYDVLVLPPTFPFGGMENACCTFLTPSIIAGDRSLVDVVVHELTHSWFGNGVTYVQLPIIICLYAYFHHIPCSAHSSHYWLNEGWTTYMERVLLSKLHSEAERDFSYLIGSKALKDALKEYEDTPKYQRLIIEMEVGEDPDDAYSSVPYEKGANFLFYLEKVLGGLDVFLPYASDYVKTFMGQSIVTDQWKEHLYNYFKSHGGNDKIKALDTVDWNAWLHGEGLTLPVGMQYDTTLATAVYALAERWDKVRAKDVKELDFKESDVELFSSNQKVLFLDTLQSYSALPLSHVSLLGSLYGLANSGNAEIRFRFYGVALLDPSSASSKHYAPVAAKWVVGEDGTGIIKGRMKFCRPTFKAVYKVDKQLARETFGRKKGGFHPLARKMIEKVRSQYTER
ncbi:zincin [Neolentinus lepideus HHB14362 ss-1]|uniref:Zincin n=1 Tax=Neolentinus lepideus HHB14362 ss-1 TaxID=1314782 RepID=A0A165S635_9AGAM|nr:zincin [Neolentinus lepideus HHB14362 ss-1]